MTHHADIFVAGASRGVGREVVRCLVEQSLSVKALLRSLSAQAELEAIGVKIAFGDALEPAQVEQAMSAPIQAVISTIGGLPKDGQRADFLGNKNLIDAAVNAGVSKFILVSSIGSGNSAVALPPQAMEALRPVLLEKEQAENYLVDSGLTYVIIRPGGLKSEPATGNGILTANPNIAGTIHRADVAQLVSQCLFSDRVNNQILSAVDRNMAYGKAEFEILNLG